MIQDDMTGEVRELKLAGYTPVEVHAELAKRHKKAPTTKAVRKYYNMDCMPEDTHARLRRQITFDRKPLRPAMIEIVNLNPDCHMGSVYDVLVEKSAGGGVCDALPGNEQTLRNFIHRLEEDGEVGRDDDGRRT